jgi:hypothetical protein
MKRGLFIRLLISLVVLLMYSGAAFGETWVKYFEAPDGSVLSYDKDSIARRSGHVKQVWFRRDVSSAGREVLLQRMREQGITIPAGYDKLAYHVVLFVINCKESKSKPLSTMDYDADGKVLFSNTSIEQTDWDEIRYGNRMMYGLKEAVCNPSP